MGPAPIHRPPAARQLLVAILEPVGSITAETSAAVDEMRRHPNPWLAAATVVVFAACVLAAIVVVWFLASDRSHKKTEDFNKLAVGDGNNARTERLHKLVAQMYSDLASDRTAAYNAIMAEFKKNHKEIVSALMSYAVKGSQPNHNGLYNTAVMLKNLSLEATQPRKADINRF